MTPTTAHVHIRIADLDAVRDRITCIRARLDALTAENTRLRRELDQARTPTPIDATDRNALADLIARTAGAIWDTTGAVDAVLGYLTDRGHLTADAAAVRADLDRVLDGADQTPAPEGTVMTPAQAWAHLLALPTGQRLAQLERLIAAATDGSMCFALDHAGRIADLTEGASRCAVEHQPDSPWVTRDDDGTLTVHWPEGATSVLIARDALDGLVAQLNRATTAIRSVLDQTRPAHRATTGAAIPDDYQRGRVHGLDDIHRHLTNAAGTDSYGNPTEPQP